MMRILLVFCFFVNLALAGFNYGANGFANMVAFNLAMALLCFMGYRLSAIPEK